MLRVLLHLGVEMTAENPFIDELCKGSHAVEKAAYSFVYYNKEGESRTFWIQPPGVDSVPESDNYFLDPLDLI